MKLVFRQYLSLKRICLFLLLTQLPLSFLFAKDASKEPSKVSTKQAKIWQEFYNLGNADYRQEAFDKAEEQYSQALNLCKKPQQQEGIFYNLGNTLFRQAQKTEQIPQKRTLLENCIKHYENALSLNPKAKDTIHNLKVAKDALEKPWIELADCSEYLAEIIYTFHIGGSVSPILEARSKVLEEFAKNETK